MTRTIDHVTFAGRDLEAMRAAFEAAGFEPVYGGTHSNGITHMYLVGFDDRSYVELISKNDPEATAPWWDEQIDADAGAAAWAVPSADIAADSQRLADAGFEVDGPEAFSRDRPDGGVVEWELTAVGSGEQGTTYPMLIMDHTPLDRRVDVTAPAAETGLAGLATTVVGTDSFGSTVRGFERYFDVERAADVEQPGFGARVVRFDDAPVAVAEPLDDDSWLADRIDSLGTLPCAYLLEPADLEAALDRFAVGESTDWNGDAAHWFDVDIGGRLGVLERR